MVFDLIDHLPLWSVPHRWYSKRTARSCNFCDLRWSLVEKNFSLWVVHRSEWFPRTRITKSSRACDCGRRPVSFLFLLLTSNLFFFLLERAVMEDICKNFSVFWIPYEMVFDLIDHLPLWSVPHRWYSKRTARSCNFCDLRWSLVEKNFSLWVVHRSEWFPRTRITKSSRACDCGRRPVSFLFLLLTSNLFFFLLERAVMEDICKNFSVFWIPYEMVFDLIDHLPLWSVPHRWYSKRTARSCNFCDLRWSLVEKNFSLWVVHRSEWFPRTRITKSSRACDCGRRPVSFLFLLLTSNLFFFLLERAVMEDICKNFSVFWIPYEMVFDLIDHLPLWSVPHRWYSKRTARSCNFCDLRWSLVEKNFSLWVVHRSEWFPRTRITKSSRACDCGRRPVSFLFLLLTSNLFFFLLERAVMEDICKIFLYFEYLTKWFLT